MIHRRDFPVGQDRSQVANVSLDDIEIGAALESLAEQPREIGGRARPR